MVSRAKMGRELNRLRIQITNLHWYVSGTVQRRVYDRRRSKLVTRTEADLPLRDEIAIVLVYQPQGISESTYFTLSWLVRQNISPVLVSNHPLSPLDHERLRPICSLIIERPNFGYDFGGYREGILTLLERGACPRALYVLNDSIWFPLRENCDAIDRARASRADLFGLFLNQSARKGGKDYIQSYFYRFGEKLVASQSFQDYWQTMRLMNDKYVVVRNFERGLTRHFQQLGFTVDYIHDRQRLIDSLLALSDDDLREVAEYRIEADQHDAERLSPILSDGGSFSEQRPRIEELIRQYRIHHAYAYAHPRMQARLGVSFLKKARTREARVQRQWLLKLGLDRDIAPEIRQEIANHDSV
ncbi:rhamnan synthesis F family protein [Paracoccus marinaquae]|uniref:Rhamnan synthesis F family protein n=1 Tax=Paracoccus marinaquae TaxID=2841926 RepID=A0ABS6AN84_9RHOB|nr:rhamnan synthesis F family protein [Paracoccus marinaquae]MBU3030906.1 rhamnan synthesis F family protein [Paracoccus marinaquae]